MGFVSTNGDFWFPIFFAGMLSQPGGETSQAAGYLESSSEVSEETGSGSGDSSEEPHSGKGGLD